MKNSLVRMLALSLAGALQLMPMLRSMLPTLAQRLAPSGWAIVFRWAAGFTAMFGYHAISSASSIAVSPQNATVGQPYVGTVTYSGGHAGSVSSMSLTNNCLASAFPIAPGLTITYNGGNAATISGTPTAAGNYAFTLKIFDSGSCGGGGNNDVRSTTLVVGSGGAGGVAPAFTAPPQSITAQVGADALLSAGASGNPVPHYYWKLGPTFIPGATNSYLHFAAVDLTNAGLYTVIASNASGSLQTNCFLSACITPGSNQLALNYTNYWPQGQAVTMYSYITNAPAGSNVYKWQYNNGDITSYSTTGNNLNLSAAQVTANKSGIYGVVFNSVVNGSTVVNQQIYYSFWAFGLPPGVQTPPQSTNAALGSPVEFTVVATGSNVLSYQWVFNETNFLSGQTASALTLNSVAGADAGTYAVIVTNHWGAVTSAPATLTVTSGANPPVVVIQPAPVSVLAGQKANFSVVAVGTDPLSYQWLKDTVALTNGGIFSGVTSNVLSLTGVQLGDAGSYSVTVTNVAGITNSTAASLGVSAPPGLSLSSAGGGAFRLSATTLPGLNYLVLGATNLASPVFWSPVASNTVPVSGQLSFTNPAANPAQFFRLVFP